MNEFTSACKNGKRMKNFLLSSLRRFALGVAVSCSLPAFSAEITVAQIGPFTGLPSPDASEVNAGAQAYFEQINQAGGINGNKISFFKLDDQFKGDVFKQQLEVAKLRKPVALISPIGSAAMSLLIKENLLKDANLIVINAIPGALAFRNPGDPKLFHVRASDGDQLARILKHGSTLGVTQIHVLYQDLPIGKGGFETIKKSAPEFGYKVATGTESKHDDASLAVAAKAANDASPQSVVLVGTPKFMADAVKQLRTAGYGRSINTLSYLSVPLLTKVAGVDASRGVGIAQTFPNPNGRSLPLHQEFQKTMAQFAPEVKNLTAFHLEGYLSARVLADGIKLAKGNTSTEALSAALRGAGEMDYGGFRVNFSKSNSGSTWVDMSVVDASGKLRY
jgi:branched-chain amino acid transport system substrate-binding protein